MSGTDFTFVGELKCPLCGKDIHGQSVELGMLYSGNNIPKRFDQKTSITDADVATFYTEDTHQLVFEGQVLKEVWCYDSYTDGTCVDQNGCLETVPGLKIGIDNVVGGEPQPQVEDSSTKARGHTYPLSISCPGATYDEANAFRGRLNAKCQKLVGGELRGALSRFLVALDEGRITIDGELCTDEEEIPVLKRQALEAFSVREAEREKEAMGIIQAEMAAEEKCVDCTYDEDCYQEGFCLLTGIAKYWGVHDETSC